MKKRRGFTAVELVIVITVMAILLILAVVNLRSTQASGRDDERKTDVENISRSLELVYKNGVLPGSYPASTVVSGDTSGADFLSVAVDLDPRSIRAPGTADDSVVSIKAATNAATTTTGVLPQPTIDTYVYQPLNSAGTLCMAPTSVDPASYCRRFFIYYMNEADNSIVQVKSIQQ